MAPPGQARRLSDAFEGAAFELRLSYIARTARAAAFPGTPRAAAMARMSDNASLAFMTFIALGTLGGVLLTSAARKQYVRHNTPDKGGLEGQLRSLRKD